MSETTLTRWAVVQTAPEVDVLRIAHDKRGAEIHMEEMSRRWIADYAVRRVTITIHEGVEESTT